MIELINARYKLVGNFERKSAFSPNKISNLAGNVLSIENHLIKVCDIKQIIFTLITLSKTAIEVICTHYISTALLISSVYESSSQTKLR